MVSREDKIQYLETKIENEKLAGSDGANCVSIARKQIELSRLYRAFLTKLYVVIVSAILFYPDDVVFLKGYTIFIFWHA